MERLNTLRQEFEESKKKLEYPFDIKDLYRLKDRRIEILREAQVLAESLNLPGTFWFNTAA
jgi:hypothetical protein